MGKKNHHPTERGGSIYPEFLFLIHQNHSGLGRYPNLSGRRSPKRCPNSGCGGRWFETLPSYRGPPRGGRSHRTCLDNRGFEEPRKEDVLVSVGCNFFSTVNPWTRYELLEDPLMGFKLDGHFYSRSREPVVFFQKGLR